MITSTRRQTLSPTVTRHFSFTRLHDQFIARAYQALIPVVSRSLERPPSRRRNNESLAMASRDLRLKARGSLTSHAQ